MAQCRGRVLFLVVSLPVALYGRRYYSLHEKYQVDHLYYCHNNIHYCYPTVSTGRVRSRDTLTQPCTRLSSIPKRHPHDPEGRRPFQRPAGYIVAELGLAKVGDIAIRLRQQVLLLHGEHQSTATITRLAAARMKQRASRRVAWREASERSTCQRRASKNVGRCLVPARQTDAARDVRRSGEQV